MQKFYLVDELQNKNVKQSQSFYYTYLTSITLKLYYFNS